MASDYLHWIFIKAGNWIQERFAAACFVLLSKRSTSRY
jgi:hypothetical protein